VLLVLGHDVALRRLGRLAQSVLVLGWAIGQLELSAASLLLLGWAIVGAAALFLGLFVLQAAASFWTVASLEVFNAFSYGGSYAAQYPITIYAKWFRRLFTYVVPLSLVGYFPMLAVLGRDDPLGSHFWLQLVAPAGGGVFLAVAFGVWQLGVRRYSSTGS
jgi:ABC-2 type transport system permease protein